MSTLNRLDSLQTEIVASAHKAVPLDEWKSLRMCARYAADGGVGGLEFEFVRANGTLDQTSIPNASHRAVLYAVTKSHWQLTQDLGQPRWFKMVVTVQHSGKFSVDFEYKDTITDLDMFERG